MLCTVTAVYRGAHLPPPDNAQHLLTEPSHRVIVNDAVLLHKHAGKACVREGRSKRQWERQLALERAEEEQGAGGQLHRV